MRSYLEQTISRIETSKQIQYLLLALITGLALALRLYKLGEWSFWIDEIFTIDAAEFVWDWPKARMPFNLLFIHYAIKWLGINEWSARLFPALVGTLTIPILFFPLRRLFGSRVALLSVFLLAVAPWHIYWSQNVRFYVLLLLFYNLGLLYLLIALEEKKPLLAVLGGLFLILALREKFTSIFFVPILVSYITLISILPGERPPWLQWKYLLLIMLPFLVYVVYDLYSYVTSGYSILRGVIVTFAGNSIDSPLRILILALFDMGIPFVVLTFFSALYQFSKLNRKWIFLLTAAILPIVIIIALSPFMFITTRYAFIALPSWIILSALLINEIWKQTQSQQVGYLLTAALLAIIVADAAGQHLLYYQLNHGNRLDWKSMLAYVETNKEVGDMVATTRQPIADYYLGDTLSLENVDQQISPEIIEQSGVRYWFVVDSEGIWSVSSEMQDWLSEHAQLLDFSYLRVREQLNLRLYLYEPTAPQ